MLWIFQAAAQAGVRRMLFLSSLAWHGHYDKYGFTKRIGEELCEYHRRNHGIRYVAVRPADFTPWGANYVNGYGPACSTAEWTVRTFSTACSGPSTRCPTASRKGRSQRG